MADSYVQLPEDSTGKKLRTEQLTVGSDTVHQEVITIANSDGTKISFGTSYSSQSFTNPSSNPTLTLDTEGKPYVEIYAKSINSGATVNIYSSIDNSNWRLSYTGTTDSSNEFHDGFYSGFRYVKVEIVDTGTGTATIEISSSR